MDSIWKVVLASSVVSTLISTGIAWISKYLADVRQNTAAAQKIARGLEEYCRKCGAEITTTRNALELSYEHSSDELLTGRGIPVIELDLSGLDRLDPDWRDRVSAFPTMVESTLSRLGEEWSRASDQRAFVEYELGIEAEMGKAAFDLAKELRTAYGLTTVYAERECREALKIFHDLAIAHQRRDELSAASNASMHAQLSAAIQTSTLSKQSGGL